MAFEKQVQNFTAVGTDLPESKLTEGFLAGEKPPANWFNNLFYRLSQATIELQEKAVDQEKVEEMLASASSSATYTATIPSTGWTTEAPYYIDVAITGLLASDNPMITPVYTGTVDTDTAIKEAWNKIDRAVTSPDNLRVYAFEEVPTTDIPVQLQVVR